MAGTRAQVTAAQREAAIDARARETAIGIMAEAGFLSAVGGVDPLSTAAVCEFGGGAAIGAMSGRTMIGAQKFRLNFYDLPRKLLGSISRLMVERNWFASSVHRLRLAVYGSGFRFASEDARKWAETSSYPFLAIHDDLLHEWFVSDAVVALWLKEPAPGTIPMIEVPDVETIDYETVAGVPQVTFTPKRQPSLKEELRERMGEKLWEATRHGRKFTITKAADDASGYDFEILKAGKSTAPVAAPSITGVMDDLDFIEAVRVGDWNGAWARREIIRHTTKGHGVSSGPNAGTTRGNAKHAELRKIVEYMKRIAGKQDLATNFDQEIKWLLFPAEYFNDSMIAGARQRLFFWSGIFGVLMLKTESQITGLTGFLMDRLRAEVEHFRARFSVFLTSIYSSPSFRKNFPSSPELRPEWSVKPLYSAKALNELAVTLSTYGIAAPPHLRALFGLDDAEQSDAMKRCHQDREAYTPPFEPRQGLLPSLFPEDYAKPQEGDVQPPVSMTMPGSPGRPAGS